MVGPPEVAFKEDLHSGHQLTLVSHDCDSLPPILTASKWSATTSGWLTVRRTRSAMRS